MKRILILALASIILLIALTIASDALYTPFWKITINSELSQYEDDFNLGVGALSKDAYDINDILKAPQSPGKSIIIQSVVNGRALSEDYRASIPLFTSKTWRLNLIAKDPNFIGISGAETLNWNLDKVPENLRVTLIDYGADSSRSSVVKTINIKQTGSYIFNVTNKFGNYRYIDIKVTKTL